MSLFTKSSHRRSSSSGVSPRSEVCDNQDDSGGLYDQCPPPRGILRNSFVGESRRVVETGSPFPHDAGRQPLQSLPASKPRDLPLSTRQPRPSPSIAKLHGIPRTSDADADRLARACGDGPFSTTSPSPYLSTEAFTGAPTRQRSQSVSVAHIQRRRLSIRAAIRDFPHPSPQQAVRVLKRLLEEETRKFKIHDYIEVEDLLSGRLWEDEDELTVDCVRDRADEDDGHDGVWRRERRERRMKEAMRRKMRLRDHNVFGTHLQDLPDAVMVPVIVTGYRHYVPAVVHATIEELYRTGLYEQDLFRTLPDRTRLFQLVARFDVPPAVHPSTRMSLPNVSTPEAGPRESPHRASLPTTNVRPAPAPSRPLSLRTESYPDICALLITYLTSLPTPLLHRSLASALWAWCVGPSLLLRAQRLRRRGDDASSSESSSESSEEESYSTRIRRREQALLALPPHDTQVAVARAVLLLLPPRALALLAALLSFFDAVVRAPGVGLQAADVGRLVGAALVGGAKGSDAQGDEKKAKKARGGREDRARETVAWLVAHWNEVCAGWEGDGARMPGVQRTRSRSASAFAHGSTGGEGRAWEGPSGSRTEAAQENAATQRARPKAASVSMHARNEDDPGRREPLPRYSQLQRSGMQRARSRSAAAAVEGEDMRPTAPNSATPQKRSGASDLESDMQPALKPRMSDTHSTARPDEHAPGTPNFDTDPVVPADVPRLELPPDLMHDRLFATPAPFDVPDLDDDASVYSTDSTSLYDVATSPLLAEPLPPSDSKPQRGLGADADAAARFVLERENAELRRRLADAVGERDEARRVVGAMRGLVGR